MTSINVKVPVDEYEIPHVPASPKSMYRRQPIFGVGINDSDYCTHPLVNGKQVGCPYYRAWHGMMQRCYDPKWHKRFPTYADCAVADEWIRFSGFRKWMEGQDWKGKRLDKDILIPGNKVYSPSTCIFVTDAINGLFLGGRKRGKKYPVGVSKHKEKRLYEAHICKQGKQEIIGRFETEQEAVRAYRSAKSDHVIQIAKEQTEPLKSALINIAALIKAGKFYDETL